MGAAGAVSGFDAQRRLSGRALGNYQVGPRVGAGGSAAVYLARATGTRSTEQLVAVKVVHDHLAEEQEFISQFLDEANLLVRLNHPNIVRVHELGRDGNTLFLVMEYLHGQPLSKICSVLARRGARIPAVVVAWLGARVAEGLAYAHALTDAEGNSLGLVHRDVSPQNVYVCYDGGVKLIDFGIARAAGRIAQTTLGRLKGKFSYMAPEQVLGRDFDHRADLFALGATLYEAAVGARLFAGADESETLQKLLFQEIPDPRTRVEGFPDELARILSRTLASDPNQRYPNGSELARELDAFVSASGGGDPREALVQLLSSLFEKDRAEQEQAMQSLSALPSVLPEAPERPSGVRTLAPATSPRALWPYVVLGLAVVLALGLVFVVMKAKSKVAPAVQPSATVPAKVSLEIATQPDVESEISVDGTKVVERPARVALDKSDRELEIVVSAEGYEPAKLAVVADRDRSVVVPLVKLPAPTAPSSDPADTAAKDKTQKTQPRDRGGTTSKKKKKDPLVTKYPF